MTGWQQVNGAARHSWRERVALDVWYVDHPSLALDLRILWMTVGVLLRADTVYARTAPRRAGCPTHTWPHRRPDSMSGLCPGMEWGSLRGDEERARERAVPLSDIGADTVYARTAPRRAAADAYVAAQEAGLHVRALPGHGVGESEGDEERATRAGVPPQ